MKWYTMRKKETDLEQALLPHVGKNNVLFHIGTDAQACSSTAADFVTVICVHNVGKGGDIIYWKDKKVKTFSLWDKLYGETERSLRVAVLINDIFGESMRDRILVHVDANPNPIHQSSNYVKQLAGMVMGYGFKHILKPDAWAASHAADHIVKNKN